MGLRSSTTPMTLSSAAGATPPRRCGDAVDDDRLKLTVNEAKTHRRKLPDETFDFLGYTFGRWYSPQTGQSYLGAGVSKKKVQKVSAPFMT